MEEKEGGPVNEVGMIRLQTSESFSSSGPIVSFSRRRLGTRHEGLWRHTKFEVFHWLAANNKILNGSKNFRCEASAKEWKVSLPTDCRPQESHIRAPNFAVVSAAV